MICDLDQGLIIFKDQKLIIDISFEGLLSHCFIYPPVQGSLMGLNVDVEKGC